MSCVLSLYPDMSIRQITFDISTIIPINSTAPTRQRQARAIKYSRIPGSTWAAADIKPTVHIHKITPKNFLTNRITASLPAVLYTVLILGDRYRRPTYFLLTFGEFPQIIWNAPPIVQVDEHGRAIFLANQLCIKTNLQNIKFSHLYYSTFSHFFQVNRHNFPKGALT